MSKKQKKSLTIELAGLFYVLIWSGALFGHLTREDDKWQIFDSIAEKFVRYINSTEFCVQIVILLFLNQ